jgi:thiamine kinase-like enzyme
MLREGTVLTPLHTSDVIERLAAQLGPASEPVPLAGGLTNRNYRVRFGDRDTVMRLCGKETDALGIDRDTEALATAQASALGIAPAVLARLDGVLVCEFLEGDVLDAAGVRARLDEAAAMLRAFHGSEALPTRFAVFELVSQQASLASVPDDFPELLATAERIRAALADQPLVPCHNDLLPANFVATPAALKLLDWEYAGMNVREFDLANLAANNELRDEEGLLAAYWGAAPSDPQRAALKLMRFMSDFREAMWGVAQQALSDLDEDYVAYADAHFARLRGQPDLQEWIAVAATA